jgi:hypothetical protein
VRLREAPELFHAFGNVVHNGNNPLSRGTGQACFNYVEVLLFLRALIRAVSFTRQLLQS